MFYQPHSELILLHGWFLVTKRHTPIAFKVYPPNLMIKEEKRLMSGNSIKMIDITFEGS